jgi:hypothetical protein
MIRGAALGLLLALAATSARAEPDLFSRETVSGLVDLRLAAADGERSWTDGGYGKGRYSGAGDDLKVTPQLAEAALVWKPRFTWDLGAVVQLDHQPEQDHAVDVTEAYLAYKPVPHGAWRYSVRAGLFYPPISQEHEDAAWGVTHSITPSAINSWVGEEVKVLAFETKLTRTVAGQELSATVAAFGFNDTSGTLLSLRGWAFDDVKTTAFGKLPLPRLDPAFVGIWRRQATGTEPTRELDGRIGYYGRLDWRTDGPAALNLFYYDNVGSKTAVTNGQWAWETRFWNLGASYDLDSRTRFLAQAMTGRTLEGFQTPQGIWIDVDFSSAYLLATRSYGKASVSARVDWFETVDRSFITRDDNNEHGWAYMAAWRYDFTPKVTLLTEVLHVTSGRLAREYIGVGPRQDQTTLQTSLRLRL